MISVNAGDVLLTVGHGRVAVNVDEKGNPIPVPNIEWLISLSLSATSAKLLANLLLESIERYEKRSVKFQLILSLS
jgi:hypothetical protein